MRREGLRTGGSKTRQANRGNHKVSVLQGTAKECYITGRTDGLEKHHIYFGAGKRAISDRYGFWVWLTPELHRGTYGVHGRDGHDLDIQLKEECQRAFEAEGHSREEFRRLIGRSYL